MDTSTTARSEARRSATRYSLGSDDHEIARLDSQAAWLDAATRVLLGAAGIGPGMRVLDLGTGLGHVAMVAADLVGAEGRVLGIDSATTLLDLAAARASHLPQVRFLEGDVRTWRGEDRFDAVVGRLILFHMADPVAVLRHHAAALEPGGMVVALDYDMGAMRTEPPEPLSAETMDWLTAAFRSAGARPMIGARLALHLAEAGLEEVRTFGIQGYLGPDDPRGPAMLSGVVRSLASQMAAAGITAAEPPGLDTLHERLAAALRASGSVVVPPVLAGAWGRRP